MGVISYIKKEVSSINLKLSRCHCYYAKGNQTKKKNQIAEKFLLKISRKKSINIITVSNAPLHMKVLLRGPSTAPSIKIKLLLKQPN